MTFEAGVTASTFKIIEDKLKEAFTDTLKLMFKIDDSEVELNFKEYQVVLITLKVDDAEGLIKKINGDQFMEMLEEKMNEHEEILKDVVLKSVSAGTNEIRLIYYGELLIYMLIS